MRVLLLCDDFYHPGEVPAEGVAPLKEKGFEFDVICDASEFNPATLKNYPVVMMCKCDNVSKTNQASWKTAAVQQAFVDYVNGGGGLLAVHSATVKGEHTEALDALIGSRFTFHPQASPVTVMPVKPHPVTSGVEAFREVDEHYRLEILASDIDILAASYSVSESEYIGVAAYVRAQGKGKVCVLTPGHNLPVWLNPQFQKTLDNSLNWLGQ